MGRTATTRAAGKVTQNYNGGTIGNKDAEGLHHLARAGFGVFSYFTGASDLAAWKTANPTAKNPNFMYNQKLEYYSADKDATTMNGYSGTGEYWTYDPVKYWPNGIDLDNASTPSNTATQEQAGMLSFFAFAPYTAVTDTYDGTVPSEVSTYDAGVTEANTKKNNGPRGVVAITANNSQSDVWVKYLMPEADANTAVDLLWGVRGKETYKETDGSDNTDAAWANGDKYNVNLTKQIVKETSAERVKFLFKHALAKVGGQTVASESLDESDASCAFKVVADIDDNSSTPKTTGSDNQAAYLGSSFDNTKTLITLKEVKIQDGKSAANDGLADAGTTSTLNNSGWFNIEQGIWKGAEVVTAGATYNVTANSTDADADNTTYTLNMDIKEPSSVSDPSGTWSISGTTGVTTTPKPLFAKENVPGLLVIPGASTEIYVTVDYVVRTADTQLSTGYSEVEQRITNKVSLASLESNKYYTIIMHLGLTSVKFEAAVADWATADGGTFDENGTYTEDGTANTEVIWLPSNVVDGTSASVTPLTLSLPDRGGNAYDIAKEGGDAKKIALTVKLGEETKTPTSVTTNASWLTYNGGNLIATENTGAARSTTVYVTFTDGTVTHTGSIVVTQQTGE